jgi:glycine/D-amino acid oxidase-like deaminating enzyme
MNNFDFIVVGGGITGSVLSYELAQKGLKVLLLEKDPDYDNATRYSYGGIAYWSGTDDLSRKLCQESREIYHNLSEELDAETEFRELDLMLTISSQNNPNLVADSYEKFAIQPQLLTPQEACEIEPLLNTEAISGVLKLPHGHIHPQKTNDAYQQAFSRLGGEIKYEQVNQLISHNNILEGVRTNREQYYAKNTVICAGGLSRSLLKELGVTINIYFTHAQLILTPTVDIPLKSLVMPAILNRINLEEKSGESNLKSLWDAANDHLISDIIDPGAIQFLDGSFCLGQISQIRTNPLAKIDSNLAEATIRQGIGKILPELQNIPGKLHHCLVAFSPDANFLVGRIDKFTALHLFSGFTSTFVFAPPLAKGFASLVTDNYQELPIIKIS